MFIIVHNASEPIKHNIVHQLQTSQAQIYSQQIHIITKPQIHRILYDQFRSAKYKHLFAQWTSEPVMVIHFTLKPASLSCLDHLECDTSCLVLTDQQQCQRAAEIFKISQVKRCFAVIGGPASGKGAQCERLRSAYQVIHLSTGALLRDHVLRNTHIGQQVANYMKRGELVPDSTIVDLTLQRCHKPDAATQGFILDGFPRNVLQAQRLLADPLIHIDAVIQYVVEEDALIKRSTGRRVDPVTGQIYHITFSPPSDPLIASRLVTRNDDTILVVKARLLQYLQTQTPILNVFTKHSVPILSIDATTTDIEEIFNRTVSAIENLQLSQTTHLYHTPHTAKL